MFFEAFVTVQATLVFLFYAKFNIVYNGRLQKERIELEHAEMLNQMEKNYADADPYIGSIPQMTYLS